MSYPWWRFKITFAEGNEWNPDPNQEGDSIDFTATGMAPADAMIDLLRELYTATDWPLPGNENPYYGREILSVRYLHCDTHGIDPVSDAILEEEASKSGDSNGKGDDD